MTQLSELPDDILQEVLLQLDGLQDLRSAILTCRAIYEAFNGRRQLLIRLVFGKEIRKLQYANPASPLPNDALRRVDSIVKRVIAHRPADAVPILEAAWAWECNGRASSRLFRSAEKLERAYSRAGSEYKDRKLQLLERVFQTVVSIRPNYTLPLDNANIPVLTTVCRLDRPAQDLCQELAQEYIQQNRLSDVLKVQKTVIARLSLKDLHASEWATKVVKSLRALSRFSEAVQLEMSMYRLCRANNERAASLDWARHLLTEYTSAGRPEEALRHQERFLADIQPGTDEHVAWARRLVSMQKRQGLTADALATKAAVWQQMSYRNPCYYGWARELVVDYRNANRTGEALAVLQTMHDESQRQLARHPKDGWLRYHAKHSGKALAHQYRSCDRLDEAYAVERMIA